AEAPGRAGAPAGAGPASAAGVLPQGAPSAPPAPAPGAIRPASVGDRIVVTGTRIARSGFATPTPVRTVSADELRFADPSSLSEALNQFPEFQNSLRPHNT